MKTRRLVVTLLFLLCGSLCAQQLQTAVKHDRVTSRVSVLDGGCNITLFESETGPVIIDSGNPEPAPAVLSTIREIDSRPTAAVVLTHYHGDHVGGLSVVAAGAPLYAHENCLASFRKQNARASEAVATSVAKLVPYSQNQTKVQIGKEELLLIHPAHGHSSGDSVVVLEKEKVIVAGDLFFSGIRPYIDVADGADTAAWADFIESMAKKYPDFKVVPGHGPVTEMAGWLEFAAYLRALREGVAEAIKAGKTREQAQAAINLDRFKSMRDFGDFLTQKANIGWVYDELKKKQNVDN